MADHPDVREVVEIARALVAVDTQNPPGDEASILPVITGFLTPWCAAETVIVERLPGRRSAVITLPSSAGPTIIFNSHVDVAAGPATNWTHAPSGEVVDGRLYGRGSADMKGGLACVLIALRHVLMRHPQPTCGLQIHVVADEERGSFAGTATLADYGAFEAASLCVIPEPTALKFACAERGVTWIRVHLRLSGSPERTRGGTVASAVAAVTLALDGRIYGWDDSPLAPAPCNVGAIKISGPPNRLPAEGDVWVDVRLQPGDQPATVVRWIRSEVEAALARQGGKRCSAEIIIEKVAAASQSAPDEPLVRRLMDAAARARGGDVPLCTMDGPTDARYYRAAGIPTVVFGPGDPALAHRPDEYVELTALSRATAAYQQFLLDVAARGASDEHDAEAFGDE